MESLHAVAFHNTVRGLSRVSNGAYICSYFRLCGDGHAMIVSSFTCCAELPIMRETKRLGRSVVVVECVSWGLQPCSDDSSGNWVDQNRLTSFRALKRKHMECSPGKGLRSRSLQCSKERKPLPECVSLLNRRQESSSADAKVIIITARLCGTAAAQACPPTPRAYSRNRGRCCRMLDFSTDAVRNPDATARWSTGSET